ncbi:MAG TPA: glycosyltransferase [Kiritimatiellia bacterium]|nr:glycosyltransferase [Kiritimatiellia bacterium]HRZ12421.1 glycosyltransferase [Kiritimatiellia bacterium]HSA17821.1 glycosyltransferase [Kiritimatiellia bacterium]
MKKVLLIAFEFPPAVASGMYHAFYLAKYLRSFDWDPFVLTGVPGAVPAAMEDPLDLPAALDEGRVLRAGLADEAELAEFAGRELPDSWLRRCVLGHRDEHGGSFRHVFPDPLVRWLPRAWRRAVELLSAHRFDAVVTTSFPFTSVLLGRMARERFGVPWVAEFRDLWTEDPRFPLRSAAFVADSGRLERETLASADAVVAVSSPLAERFVRRGGGDRVRCIELSYEEADFAQEREPPSDRFHLVQAGTLYPGMLPAALPKALDLLARLGKLDPARFGFTLAGANLCGQAGLSGARVLGHVPHAEALRLYRGASALLLTLPAELGEFIPSRLFEYMASGAPILALVPPDSVAARMVLRSRTGTVVDIAAGVDEVAAAVYDLYVRGRDGTLTTDPDWAYIRGFSSRAMAGRWAALLNGLRAGERVQ